MSTITTFEIPLIPTPQTLSIVLNSVPYQLRVVWNSISQCWVMDISDASGTPILQGVPLVTSADLLEQFGYLNFGGKLLVQTDNAPDSVPTFKNLGSTGHLYFQTVSA